MPRIEYRVRAVTRYIVTRHENGSLGEPGSGSLKEFGEFPRADLADTVATGLADQERRLTSAEPTDVYAIAYAGPPPGRVMRCKVTLTHRAPAWKLAEWGKGTSDPANLTWDGESLTFHAICPPTCNGAPNASPENAIFGEFTPMFALSAQVRNQDVLDALERGRDYYVDFTPAPLPAS